MHKTPKECKYRRRCPSCQKSHHTLLACVPTNLPSSTTAGTSNATLNIAAPAFQSVVCSTSKRLCANTNTNTAKYSPSTFVVILGSDGIWRKAVALFDSGSDVTLIRKNVVASLKLERKPQAIKFGTAGGGFWTKK